MNQQSAERPAIVAGYGIRKDGQGLLDWAWVDGQLARSKNYWVGSTRPDGRPHAMPVWGVWVQDRFCFATDRNSVKGRNLLANPQVVVHVESGDDTVILEGMVVEERDPERLKSMAAAYNAKYTGVDFELVNRRR